MTASKQTDYAVTVDGHLVTIAIPNHVAILSDEEAGAFAGAIFRASFAARERRKQLTGATGWVGQVIGDQRALVTHDDHTSVFSRHMKSAQGRFATKTKCAACEKTIEPGSPYWREADEVKRKRWSGWRLCDPCVRPEVRGAELTGLTAKAEP